MKKERITLELVILNTGPLGPSFMKIGYLQGSTPYDNIYGLKRKIYEYHLIA
jgi:hypothetical protein